MYTFTQWVPTPESRSALEAVKRVADAVCASRPGRDAPPLFLHGPPGTGKTHLVSALADDVTRRRPDRIVVQGDGGVGSTEWFDEVRPAVRQGQVDLLVVEDVQQLRPEAAAAFAELFDACQTRRLPLVLTARAGPARLTHLPARLTSRLAGGLVVGLAPLAPASRLTFLQDRVQRRGVAVRPEVLTWLADHLAGSGRELDGAVNRLEVLARMAPQPPDLVAVAELFRDEDAGHRPTVERIAERVGRYYRLSPRDLQARSRCRQALVPRQVGMYLARRLTRLSLEQIGAYFGGRDHSTVLHACHKVEQGLTRDAVLSGAVTQLHAELA